MKKFYVIFLATIMLANTSITAFAAEENNVTQDTEEPQTSSTTVSFNVEPSYTITIPTSIELEKNNDTYEKEMYITADDVLLKENEYVKVTLTSDFYLDTDDDSTYILPYIATLTPCAYKNNDNPIKSGDEIARFSSDTNGGTMKEMCFSAETPDFAGTYTDIVTFTISVATDVTE